MRSRAAITAGLLLGTAVAGAMVGLGVIASGTGCGGGGFCHDDRPALGTRFVQGGAACTLPNGRPGVGMGSYGCVDPTLCHCKAEAGSAICAAGAVCVYAACSGANEGAACALAGGAQGTCCNGVCSSVNLRTDPSNCGGCSNICPNGVTCDYGSCRVLTGTSPACPSGLALARAPCVSGTCTACFTTSCGGLSDGAPCVVQPDAGQTNPLVGLCCHGACVDWATDDQNCGGCGVTCCPGTHCHGSYSNPPVISGGCS